MLRPRVGHEEKDDGEQVELDLHRCQMLDEVANYEACRVACPIPARPPPGGGSLAVKIGSSGSRGGYAMAQVKLVQDKDASADVRAVFDDIRRSRNTDY